MSNLADLPKLAPYTVIKTIGNDNFYTHYKAIDTHLDGTPEFLITEFNPSFMVMRTEDGMLEPTDRFIIEYETALERFTKMGEALLNLNEPFIAPIEGVLLLNNTAYIVRRVGGRYRRLDEGLQQKPMDFSEAYVILRPLIQSLVVAWKNGLLFEFAPGDMVVNSYGQLILDSMFAWENDHRNSIKEIVKVYYRLIAGVEYNPGRPDNPSIDSLNLPPRLNITVKDILTGEPHYGSIDDFNKQLRMVMDAEGRKEIISIKTVIRADDNLPKVVRKNAAVGIFAGIAAFLLLFIAAPLLWIFLPGLLYGYEYYVDAGAYPYEVSNAEEPALNAIQPANQAAFVRLHTGYAITDPGDPTVMLNGSFYQDGNVLYYRMFRDGYGLSYRDIRDGSAGTLLIRDVRPSFITSHGGYIYFSDGLANYNIRRMRTDSSGLETISNHVASFLHVSGYNLFYTNHSNRDFLYTINLNTMQAQPFLRIAAYEPVVRGGQLYFVNGNSNFRIYSVLVNRPDAPPTRHNSENSDNLRLDGGNIFYRDAEANTIKLITAQGRPADIEIPLAVASFDIYDSMIAIIEAGTQELWVYNINTQELVSTGYRAAYATIGSEGIYIIDFDNTRINHFIERVDLTGEETAVEEATEVEPDEAGAEDETDEEEIY